ncbi:MAG TPA: hypothetical protein VKE51_23020 [Vicinamibacterales bacterium]|nr:hypothetical protein [Vicinamibacterales bacterium]
MRAAHEPGRRRRAITSMLLGCLGLAGAIVVAQAPAGGGRGGRGAVPPNPLGQPLIDQTGHVPDDVCMANCKFPKHFEFAMDMYALARPGSKLLVSAPPPPAPAR